MKSIVFIISIIIVTLSTSIFAQEVQVEYVKFLPGNSGTSIKNTITGSQSVNYKLSAKAGQTMNITLKGSNASNYFNLYTPRKSPGDEALFVGSMNGNQYSGKLPTDGEYTISVFLMRNAARRNEKSNYTLDIKITGQASKSSLKTETHSKLADATGNLSCSAGEPNFKHSCAFKVKRNNFGATIWATKPDTDNNPRVLYYENKTFSTDDGTKISSQRQGDNWWVGVGKKEFYLIPDAVIFGG